jgi:hypothetical protein
MEEMRKVGRPSEMRRVGRPSEMRRVGRPSEMRKVRHEAINEAGIADDTGQRSAMTRSAATSSRFAHPFSMLTH